jgi:hypothetical protein
MCGAALDEEAVVAEIAPTRQLTRKQLLILSGVAVVILVASVITGLTLSRGGVLPTPTPTVTFTPTITLTPTVTPTPTETPVPLPTSTPIPPQSYTVHRAIHSPPLPSNSISPPMNWWPITPGFRR